MTDKQTENWQKKAEANQKKYRHFLKTADKRMLLKKLPDMHEDVVAETDCLTCAACCKNYSPRFKTPDIRRIAKHLGIKEGVLIENYLTIDEDGDYVLKQTPCSFLSADNRCSIYAVRPSDCARFPYTDEDVLFKRPNITLENVRFCPIVFQVLEKIMQVSQ